MVSGSRDLTLAVCGCSWLSCDDLFPGTHFSELLARNHNLNLLSLARQGISNSGIRLQVQRAIDCDADIIIMNSTTANRFELPLHSVWSHLPHRDYATEHSIDNVEYRFYPNPSRHHINSNHVTMISDHVSKFYTSDFDGDFTTAWKHYITHIYHEPWKQQQDRWIVESSLSLLLSTGKPFIYMPVWHHMPGHPTNTLPQWLPSGAVYDSPDLVLTDFVPSAPLDVAAYHTSPGFQKIFLREFEPRFLALLEQVDQ